MRKRHSPDLAINESIDRGLSYDRISVTVPADFTPQTLTQIDTTRRTFGIASMVVMGLLLGVSLWKLFARNVTHEEHDRERAL